MQISQITQSGKKALVVFDLDSTLFDVSPRIQRILHDFSHDPKFMTEFPESCKILRTIEIQRGDWGIKNSLVRVGLDGHPHEFHLAIRDYWKKTFFSNDYLKYDKPYEGAVAYVQAIFSAGAEICYLTGRDVARMGQGSLQGLIDWKLPVNESKAKLVLKPKKDMDDAQFKSDYFSPSLKKEFSKIWFFENEPVNIHLVRRQHPDVDVVFFDSTHSGLGTAPQDLPTIMHYLLEGEE